MNNQPIRQATEEQVLLLLRDRQDELRLLIGEPLATFSMPVAQYARILVIMPRPFIPDDSPWFVTIDDRTVCVPVQLADGAHPIPCGRRLQSKPDIGDELAAAIALRRRQAFESI